MNDRNTSIFKRLLAWIGLLFFLIVFISLIIHLISGAGPGEILAHLFCLIVIPCIFYLILWLKKVLIKK